MAATFSGRICLWLDENNKGRSNLPAILHKGSAETDEVFWGYKGSGPLDLALSVLAALLPGEDIELQDGQRCSSLAYNLSHTFLEDYIAKLPETGGILEEDEIMDWVQTALRFHLVR